MSSRSRSARTKPFCMGDNYINSLFKLLPSDLQKNDRLKLAIRNLKARSTRDDNSDLKSLKTDQSLRSFQSQDQFLKRNKELRDDLMKSIGELKMNIKDVQQLIETQTQKLTTQHTQLDLLSNSVDEKIASINEEYKNVMLERTVTDAIQVNMNLVNCVENLSKSYGLKSDQLSTGEDISVTDETEISSTCGTDGDKTSESDSDTTCDEVNSKENLSSYHDLAKKVRQKYDPTVAPDFVNPEAARRKSQPQLVTQPKCHALPQLLSQPLLPVSVSVSQAKQPSTQQLSNPQKSEIKQDT